jgi:hypothetical protein
MDGHIWIEKGIEYSRKGNGSENYCCYRVMIGRNNDRYCSVLCREVPFFLVLEQLDEREVCLCRDYSLLLWWEDRMV